MKNFKIDETNRIPTGFKTPDGYFENFAVQLPQAGSPKVIALPRRRSWIYAAAAVLILSLAIPLLNRSSSSSEAVENETIEHYIALNDIPLELLVEGLDDEAIDRLSRETALEDESIELFLENNPNLEQIID
jgi:hypothetical protein